jgi:hypothetical protein
MQIARTAFRQSTFMKHPGLEKLEYHKPLQDYLVFLNIAAVCVIRFCRGALE